MKAFCVQMIDLCFVFQFVEGRCHGNQLILGTCEPLDVILRADSTGSFGHIW